MNLEQWLKNNGIPTDKGINDRYNYQMARQFQDCWICAVLSTKDFLLSKLSEIDFKNSNFDEVNNQLIIKLQEFLTDVLKK
jgi:hypothetical protein